MPDASPGGPLDAEELRTLATLMARYCDHHLDQWEFWKLEMSYGSNYVCLSAGDPAWERDHETIDWRKYATVWPRRDDTPKSDA